jgi:hypothetical protein
VSMGFEGNRMPADQDRNPTEIPEEPLVFLPTRHRWSPIFLTRTSASLGRNARRWRRAIVERMSMADDLTERRFRCARRRFIRALDKEEDAPGASAT